MHIACYRDLDMSRHDSEILFLTYLQQPTDYPAMARNVLSTARGEIKLKRRSR
jgi:hypothetical protein